MALTLIKEDGTGKEDANSYASAADGDAYYDGHLYATAWTAAILANKEKALVFATRLIDSQFLFNGVKAHETQSLQWPREACLDRDALDGWAASDVVPVCLRDATCEMARELLVADRTGTPLGEGLRYEVDGTIQKGYDKRDRKPILSYVTQGLLAKYGSLLKSRSGSVGLIRV